MSLRVACSLSVTWRTVQRGSTGPGRVLRPTPVLLAGRAGAQVQDSQQQ